MDVRVKFGNSRLNSCRIIRLFTGRAHFMRFVQYLIAFCTRPEAAGDVISRKFMGLTVPDEHVKLRDPHLNRGR